MIKKRTLNKAIKAAGNQSRLAEYLGISRQMVCQIKKGIRPFPKGKIGKLETLISSNEGNP